MNMNFMKHLGVTFSFLAIGYLLVGTEYAPVGAQLLLSEAPSGSTDTGVNNGKPVAGGSLEGACEDVDTQLTAIRPLYSQDGLTERDSPTLVFYVPYDSEKIIDAEFRLLPVDESSYVYKETFDLSSTPGIVTITFDLPAGEVHQLTDEYRWYLNIRCESDVIPSVDGWIQHTSGSDSVNQLTPHYDLIANTVEQLQSSPDLPSARTEWTQTLEMVSDLSIDQFPDYSVVRPSLIDAAIADQYTIPSDGNTSN